MYKNKNITKLLTLLLTIMFVFTFVVATDLFSAQSAAPNIQTPQAAQNQQTGPSPSQAPGTTTTPSVSEPWTSTTWATLIIIIVSALIFIILLLLYRKEKSKNPESKKTKIIRFILLAIAPLTYLIVLIIVLSSRVYTHSIDAIMVNFNILGMEIRIAYYGVIYALGFVIAYIWMRYEIKFKKLDFKTEELDTYFIFGCIGVVLGARVFEAIFYVEPWYNFFWWREGFASWSKGWKFIKVWEGGLSAHGGIIGLVIATLWFCKRKGKSFYQIMDIAVIPVALGLALGRFANYINGELYGVATSGDWGIIFSQAAQPGATNLPRIPVQIFESFKNLLIFSIILALRPKLKKPGLIAWTWVLLYGLFRFVIELWKDYATLWKIGDLNFTMGNILCLAMIGSSAFVIFTIYKGSKMFTSLPSSDVKVKSIKTGKTKKKLKKKK